MIPASLRVTQRYIGGNRFSLSFQVLTADNAPVPSARIVVVDTYDEETEILTDDKGFALRTFRVDERGPERGFSFFVPGSPIEPRDVSLYSQSE